MLSKVQWHTGEIGNASSIKKEELEIVWDFQEGSEIFMQVLCDVCELFLPVAEFDHTHSHALIVEQLVMGFLEHIRHQLGGAWVQVVLHWWPGMMKLAEWEFEHRDNDRFKLIIKHSF
jgi:hypothetical protein